MMTTGAPIEWVPDGPYGLSKYDSLRDEYLHAIASDDSDERSGEVDSPTGWFALLIIKADEIADLQASFGRPVEGIIGNFILTESSQGFGYVAAYETEAEARAAFESLDTEYGNWLGDE